MREAVWMGELVGAQREPPCGCRRARDSRRKRALIQRERMEMESGSEEVWGDVIFDGTETDMLVPPLQYTVLEGAQAVPVTAGGDVDGDAVFEVA